MYAYTILAFYLLSSKQVRLSTKKLAWSDTIDFDKSNFIDFITCFPSAHKLIFLTIFQIMLVCSRVCCISFTMAK